MKGASVVVVGAERVAVRSERARAGAWSAGLVAALFHGGGIAPPVGSGATVEPGASPQEATASAPELDEHGTDAESKGPAPEPELDGPAPEPELDGPAPEPDLDGPAPEPDLDGPAPEPDLDGPAPEPALEDDAVPAYDPLRDSPEWAAATGWSRAGIVGLVTGGALTVGAIAMGTSDPGAFGAGNNNFTDARDRAALIMGVPGGLLLVGGAAMLIVGERQKAGLRVAPVADLQRVGVTVVGRF